MNKKEKIKCNIIIHTATVAAGTVGAATAKIPCADSIPLSGIQITMVVSLGRVFNIKVAKSAARAIITAFAASFVGRELVHVASGWIPVMGEVINASTAVGLTEIMGWFVANSFAKDMSIEQTINEIKKKKNENEKDNDNIKEKEIPKLNAGRNPKEDDKEIKINIPEYSDEYIIGQMKYEEEA